MAGLLSKVKSMMLGTDYEEEDEAVYEEYDEEDVEPTREREKEVTDINVVRSSRRSSSNSKIVNFQTSVQMEVVLTYPNVVQDSTAICDSIRDNKTCIVNLEGVERANAQRIADFLGGAAYALGGEIQRVSNEIFIIAPANVHLSGELKAELKASGLLVPWAASFK